MFVKELRLLGVLSLLKLNLWVLVNWTGLTIEIVSLFIIAFVDSFYFVRAGDFWDISVVFELM